MGAAAIIFPGQGSQVIGMGKDVAAASTRGRAVFDRANEQLGFDIGRICFEGPAEQLEKTDIQQPAIFVTSVAIWEAFVEKGGRIDSFKWTGGLSLGEYTALHVAGAVGFDDALRLVRRRGELMQQASESGMVSLIGADEEKATALCERARGDGVLVEANFNCPGQIVLSGNLDACARAVEQASAVGCRAVSLPVAGAFHSPLMEPAAEGLHRVLGEIEFSAPVIPVIANVNAEAHPGGQATRDWLRRQLMEPVRWQRGIERMIAGGAERFFEFGPGRVLTGLMRKIDRKVKAVNVSTIAGVEEAVAALCG
ncbi:MAG: ACP S-malonyltransferase [Phycisphaerae bacterium]|jgi:[acyl-carrier-protein] S-malonyltransferase